MLKRWCSIKKIEVCLLCEILISKGTAQGQKIVASLPKNRNRYAGEPSPGACLSKVPITFRAGKAIL